jgi:hypothetical protein
MQSELRPTVLWVKSEIAATALISGSVGLVIGLSRDTIKGVVSLAFQSNESRRAQARAMREVVMDVGERWEGYAYEFNGLTVVGMRVSVNLRNFSDQLVKNVHVRMYGRPEGLDFARMLTALPPSDEPVSVTIERDLGLDDDRPYREEEPDWLDYYWFEADFDDVHGRGWRLTYNPRDRQQSVEPRTGP